MQTYQHSRSASLRAVSDAGGVPEPLLVPVFARHETFAPRAGWLKKGFEAALEDERVFLAKDAATRLGVGKNMARSIRYWCHAFRLLEDAPIPGARALASRPTDFGMALLGPDGFDPYLEDRATLWQLHWQLVSSSSLATAWHYTFGLFPEREFTIDQLDAGLRSHARQTYPTARAADTSLHKDVLCLIRMYGEAPAVGTLTEESIRCPFAELGLVRPGSEPRSYAFDVGEKPDLPPQIVVAACLEFAARSTASGRTIPVGRLLYDVGGPGMAFKLNESALVAAIDEVSRTTRLVGVADTAGLVQMTFKREPLALSSVVLKGHYAAIREQRGEQ